MTITPHHTTPHFTISGWTRIHPSIGNAVLCGVRCGFVPHALSRCPYVASRERTAKENRCSRSQAVTVSLCGYQIRSRRGQKSSHISRLANLVARRVSDGSASTWREGRPGKHALGRVGAGVPPDRSACTNRDHPSPHTIAFQNLTLRFSSLANGMPHTDSELLAGESARRPGQTAVKNKNAPASARTKRGREQNAKDNSYLNLGDALPKT